MWVREHNLRFSDLLCEGVAHKRRELYFQQRNEEYMAHFRKIRERLRIALQQQSIPYHHNHFNHIRTMTRMEHETGDITLDDVHDTFLKLYRQYLPKVKDSSVRGPTKEEIAKYPPGTKFKDTNSKP